jgi:hypothetical protein
MKLSVDELNLLVARIAGEQAALRYAISLLIATHPEPALLGALWHDAKNLAIDQAAESVLFQVREYRESFLAALSGLSGEIDAAQASGPADTPPDPPG